jgi:hypothetical protein
MPLGVSVGVATLVDRLHVTLRYRHAQFGPDAARRFTRLYRDVLLGSSAPEHRRQPLTPGSRLRPRNV